MEYKNQKIDKKEIQNLMKHTLQVEHALDVANQKIEVLTKAINSLAEDNTNQRIRIAELELR